MKETSLDHNCVRTSFYTNTDFAYKVKNTSTTQNFVELIQFVNSLLSKTMDNSDQKQIAPALFLIRTFALYLIENSTPQELLALFKGKQFT
jgi:hypothetical protein